MIKYMIMNKDLTEVYAGTTVYDDEQWANKQLERLQCSNNWSVKQVSVEPVVKVNFAEDIRTMKDAQLKAIDETIDGTQDKIITEIHRRIRKIVEVVYNNIEEYVSKISA